MMLSQAEYAFILQRDFMSFIERSFYELNPQTRFIAGPHIEIMAAKLEACRHGQIRPLIINLPPRNPKSHCRPIAFVAWSVCPKPARPPLYPSYWQELAPTPS